MGGSVAEGKKICFDYGHSDTSSLKGVERVAAQYAIAEAKDKLPSIIHSVEEGDPMPDKARPTCAHTLVDPAVRLAAPGTRRVFGLAQILLESLGKGTYRNSRR